AMTYGPAKRRDIARSVLPSTNRQRARRELAVAKRRARRLVRKDLAGLTRVPGAADVVDAYDEARFDPLATAARSVRYAVADRRLDDKLGPLERWARAITRDVPLEDRLDAVRRVLDDNLIGRHALSHLELDDHFYVPYVHDLWWEFRERRLAGAAR